MLKPNSIKIESPNTYTLHLLPIIVLVRTKNLSKNFGEFRALRDCSLEIEPGIVFGLLGPNGAGKTTLLRLILGFMFPTNGSASVDGFDCHSQSVDAHSRLTYLPGDAQLFGSMKGKKVLKFFARLRSDCDFKVAMKLSERLDLDLNRRVAFMSTGMRQKLALCVCLSTNAKLTILDEPTANLDPTVRGEVIKIIDEIKRQGRTVIFSSHVLSEIEDVCDRVVVMKKGEIVRDLDMAELKSRHRITATVDSSIRSSDRSEKTNPTVEKNRDSIVELIVPEELRDSLSMQQTDANIRWDADGDLAPALRWLAAQPIRNVRIEPMGLRRVYDECHFGSSEITSGPKGQPVAGHHLSDPNQSEGAAV